MPRTSSDQQNRGFSTNEEKGSIVTKEAPIAISKLMVIDQNTDEPTRIGRKKNSEGKLQRYSKEEF